MTKYYTPRMSHTIYIYKCNETYELVGVCKDRKEAAEKLGVSVQRIQQKLDEAGTPKRTRYLLTRTKK